MSDQQENDMCPLCEHEFYNSEIAAIREENARLRLLFAKYRDAIASIHRSDWSDDVGDFTRHTEEDDCWICDLIVPVDAALASACHVPVRGRARAIIASELKEERGADTLPKCTTPDQKECHALYNGNCMNGVQCCAEVNRRIEEAGR